MRILVELLIAAGLIAAAWQTPYRERLGQVIPSLAEKSSGAESTPVEGNEQPRVANREPGAATAGPQAAPALSPSTQSGNWMWDPKRPGSLDRPGQSATPTVFTKHIYYTDEKGKKYWIDAQGKRHYDS